MLANGLVFQSTGGQVGGAVAVSGSGEITVPNSSALESVAPVTISAWINPYAGPGNMYTTDAAGNGNGYIFAVGPNGELAFWVDLTVNPDLDRRTPDGVGVVNFDEWTHVVATWDGGLLASGIKIYVNAAEVGSYVSTNGGGGTFNDSANTKRIGQNFKGMLDDVRVYNRVLSVAEIDKIYQAGLLGLAAQDCTDPNAAAGTMIYNRDVNRPQYCDGREWVWMGDP